MIFVDTNYFARFLLKDVPGQYLQAEKLFKDGAQGKIKLITSVVVLFEIYWLFKSFYRKTKSEIIKILQNVLNMNFIRFERHQEFKKALELFTTTRLELEDCYYIIFAKSEGVKDFKTFDKKLAREFKK